MSDLPLLELLGLRHPLIQGGMTWVSRHGLAAAVSESGALGVIGSGGMEPEELRDEIRALRGRTDRPFGVNVPLIDVRPAGPGDVVEEMVRVVLDERVPIVITGAGSPRKYTPRLRSAGARVLHVVATPEMAKKCEAAGVDAVVAEGVEAGGHVRADGLSTLALVPQVVDAVRLPVVAAGGIADGRGMAAALTLGAAAVQIGTRFIATVECNAHEAFKRALVDAGPESARVYSRCYHASRGLDTPAVRKLIEMEARGASQEELVAVRGRGRARAGCIDGDLEEGLLPAGTGAGLVRDVPTVAELVEELVRTCGERLGATYEALVPGPKNGLERRRGAA